MQCKDIYILLSWLKCVAVQKKCLNGKFILATFNNI